ncbi:flagellar biosynthesis protein FlhB [Oscillospiraceae bacterium]|nr:flagellar biosynthesis protein FlhB [Oscillospiraceae bacterium]BDF76500.1 flagellar biosynthesis protein FlhB [Oscillospiraceae bacterium]
MPEGNKTEKATPKKRRDERKKGNVFLSNDAVAVASLIGCFAVLRLTAGSTVAQLDRFFGLCMDLAGAPPAGGSADFLGTLVWEGAKTLALTVGPILAAAVLSAVAATFLQTKLLVSGDSIKPKFSRLSPLQGVKRLFSLRSLVEALKGTLKIAVLLVIIYRYLRGILGTFSNYLYLDLTAACAHLFDETFSLVVQIAVVFTVLAGFDFFYQWWEYERQMRMSKQEVKEEYKQMEGDPQIKGKIKETQRKMAQSRMMQKVPQADVVVRNPTHVAVALRYRPETDPAPVVLAKGLDELALRIVKVAGEHGVAVVENVALARALYPAAELDREIPPEFYGAVADVLVYLYRVGAGEGKAK